MQCSGQLVQDITVDSDIPYYPAVKHRRFDSELILYLIHIMIHTYVLSVHLFFPSYVTM